MYADLIIPALKLAERQGIVEILGVGRVYREGQSVPEILAALEVVGGDTVGDLVRGVLHFLGETVREAELREDRVHFGIIVARHAQHIHDVALRADVVFLPTVHYGGGLHTGLAAHLQSLLLVHLDVVRHRLALHQHPRLGTHEMENADVRTGRALYDLDHLAFAALHADLLLGQRYADGVAVQRILRLGRLDEDVVLFALHDNEDKAFPAHLDLAYELGIALEGLGAAAPAAPPGGLCQPGAVRTAVAAAGTSPAVSFI